LIKNKQLYFEDCISECAEDLIFDSNVVNVQ